MFTFVSGVQIHLPTKVCTKGISMGSRRFGDMTIVADNQYKADLKKNFRTYSILISDERIEILGS